MSVLIENIGKFCVFIYVFGMLFNIVCNTSTQKSLRLLFVLYVIATVLNSFRFTEFKLDIPSDKIYQENISKSSEYIIPAVQQEIESIIKNQLYDKNISYKDVKVHIIEQKEYIKIDRIVFYGISENNKSLIEDLYSKEGTIIFED